MAFDILGTPKSVTIDGVSYDVQADANFKQNKTKYMNEPQVTSGRVMQKQTRQAQTVESITLATNESEDEDLKARADAPGSYPMSYTTIDGTVHRCVGFISYEGRETNSGTTTIKMIPTSVNGWSAFIAG